MKPSSYVRVLRAEDLERALSMQGAIECLRIAYQTPNCSSSHYPDRSLIHVPERDAVLGVMTAFGGPHSYFVTKVAALHRQNFKQQLPTVHAVVLVFAGDTGELRFIIEGAAFTALRTAATCGLVTDLLAPRKATSFAMIGTGVQARKQFEAVCAVRQIRQVFVFSRKPEHIASFVLYVKTKLKCRAEIVVAHDIERATADAEIICTATTCATPFLTIGNVPKNCHINAMGMHTTDSREVDDELLRSAFIVVEERHAAIREAGTHHARACEIRELFSSNLLSMAQHDRTIFSSVGTPFQDLMIASALAQGAESNGVGRIISL